MQQINSDYLIDKLEIRTLELIQDAVKLKTEIERTTKQGAILLAKTRYSQGSNSVSSTQLPTENSKEFNALTVVDSNKDESGSKTFQIACRPIDEKEGTVNPLKWFGVLQPPSLVQAKAFFYKAVVLSAECASTQTLLNDIVYVHNWLKNCKSAKSK